MKLRSAVKKNKPHHSHFQFNLVKISYALFFNNLQIIYKETHFTQFQQVLAQYGTDFSSTERASWRSPACGSQTPELAINSILSEGLWISWINSICLGSGKYWPVWSITAAPVRPRRTCPMPQISGWLPGLLPACTYHMDSKTIDLESIYYNKNNSEILKHHMFLSTVCTQAWLAIK